MRHALAGQPGRQELPARGYAVLALGKLSDLDIWTLMTFDV